MHDRSGDLEEYTLEEELLARARIHARSVDIDVDRDRLEWAVSARAKRRAGACRWDPRRAVATIVLARRAYEAYDWPEFAAVVRHELVHAWEFQHFGESGHGQRFHEMAARVDAPRHCDSFTEPRYVLRCRACSWRARRHRASKPVATPEQYRCGACGENIEVCHTESGRIWRCAAGFERTRAALGSEW